jgi:hypothetical protein
MGFLLALLQSTQVNIDVNAKSSGGTVWYTTWWFWVLVGLFALIVIIALTTRGRPARE